MLISNVQFEISYLRYGFEAYSDTALEAGDKETGVFLNNVAKDGL